MIEAIQNITYRGDSNVLAIIAQYVKYIEYEQFSYNPNWDTTPSTFILLYKDGSSSIAFPLIPENVEALHKNSKIDFGGSAHDRLVELSHAHDDKISPLLFSDYSKAEALASEHQYGLSNPLKFDNPRHPITEFYLKPYEENKKKNDKILLTTIKKIADEWQPYKENQKPLLEDIDNIVKENDKNLRAAIDKKVAEFNNSQTASVAAAANKRKRPASPAMN